MQSVLPPVSEMLPLKEQRLMVLPVQRLPTTPPMWVDTFGMVMVSDECTSSMAEPVAYPTAPNSLKPSAATSEPLMVKFLMVAPDALPIRPPYDLPVLMAMFRMAWPCPSKVPVKGFPTEPMGCQPVAPAMSMSSSNTAFAAAFWRYPAMPPTM